jgi:hypothetical protein
LYLDPNDPAAQMLLQEAGITLGQNHLPLAVISRMYLNSKVGYCAFNESGHNK